MFLRTTIAAASMLLLASVGFASPIHDAAAAGDVETVMSLIKAGTSPDELNEVGETPLIVTARLDQKEVANVLMRLLADPTLKAPNGMTALHFAVAHDDANLIYVLASTGTADVNARDAQGATPLILAAEAGKGQSLAALRGDWNADLEISDNDGRTALTRAGAAGQMMIINILIRYGALCQESDPAWFAECTERRRALGK